MPPGVECSASVEPDGSRIRIGARRGTEPKPVRDTLQADLEEFRVLPRGQGDFSNLAVLGFAAPILLQLVGNDPSGSDAGLEPKREPLLSLTR